MEINLSNDIVLKITSDFSLDEQELVIGLLMEQEQIGLNVPFHQFVRSIIFLANGSLQDLKNKYLLIDDPRDVISEAEVKAGRPGHWFAMPFDAMSTFVSPVEEQTNYKIEKGFDDGLPF